MLYIEHLFIQDIRASWSSRYSPPLVLSDLLLLGAGRSHCVPAQLAEHLRAVKRGEKHRHGKGKQNGSWAMRRRGFARAVRHKRRRTERASKKSRSTCGKRGEEGGKEDGMRQERQVSVSLVFRRDRVGVMRMTLVRGDI